VATARSYSVQDAARQSAPGGSSRPTSHAPHGPSAPTWNVLAKLPAVSGEERPDLPANVSTASRTPSYRFDLPESPRPHATIESIKSGSQAIDSPSRSGGKASYALSEAAGLPLWARPSQSSTAAQTNRDAVGNGLANGFGSSLIRFLVLVALFTAAGLSLRMMFTTIPVPTTGPQETPSRATDHAASAASVRVPLEPTAPLMDALAEPTAPAPIAADLPPPITIVSTTLAVEEVPMEPIDDRETAKVVYPKSLRPMPTEIERLEPDQDASQSTEQSPAIARLPGYILEVPPRQARYDHDETHLD
jgi:hypothetical protein